VTASPTPQAPGACVWFTGLSGSGKSTTARAVHRLLEERGRVVTMLDGDVVRTHLSRGLGFSREDRDENVRRVAFVAAEIVRHGGLVVCALVSPYRAARAEARAMVGSESFVEVFVDTPLEVCAERDVKGLYAGAQPEPAELRLETVGVEVRENAQRVLDYLEEQGFLAAGP
jgi:sulfate adenylyltransferase